MQKIVIASIVAALFAATGLAQAQEAAKKPTKPVSAKKVPAATHKQAVEEATPTEDYDPADKLSEDELAIAKRVYVGEMPCELGAKVTVKAMKREGFFFVTRGVYRYVMRPVESRTGAIRLEDQARGALWLQLGNKSMLMNQKEGKRLADECQSPQQVQFAAEMKTRPPINILEPAPKTQPAAAAAEPASPSQASAPAK